MVFPGIFNFFRKDAVKQVLSFYDLSCKTIDGNDFRFDSLKNKKVLIVNVASKCGFTPQYAELEKLYRKYGGKDFEILGFPSNDFLKQEDGSDQEIKAFCSLTYGVSFPMMSKIKVRGGDKHPVYKWLTGKNMNVTRNSRVKWNFQKYLIDQNGRLAEVVPPRVSPFSKIIIDFIEAPVQP